MATSPLNRSIVADPLYVDESRYERIDGQVTPRPMPGDVHADAQDAVKTLLNAKFKDMPFRARSEWSLTRPDQAGRSSPDYLTPDVLVARTPYERTGVGHLIRPAMLAVEIVSPEQRGLFRKAEIYAAWGVEHVWIIDPQSQECFEFHGGNQFTIASETLTAGELTLAVSDIFAGHDLG